ncbi:serine/arginine repetitive matrix protein 5 isoform X1 [Procambarus clarkii]|uniref:serine/arginine repetitive matrix protein 5 isoform X1 n=1 Tax=Procambarus clarkii TaxID=6728 RepID=UPI003744A5D8
MGESVVLYQRCLAIKLSRDLPPPALPSAQPEARTDVGARPWSRDQGQKTLISPTSPPTGSDTPTPTNGPSMASLTTSGPTSVASNITHITNHQDGYLLFLAWQAANLVCVWDKELVMAVEETEYVGHLVGGILLVGGRPCVLATLTHAWSRALLAAPTGFNITMFGELSGCSVVKVPQGQFTPLGDALCWVIHKLTRDGGHAEAETVRTTLAATFPSLVAPDLAHIHATLSNLIRQCKVFYTGHSYGIVQPNTYQPMAVPDKSPSISFTLSPTGSSSHPLLAGIDKTHLCGAESMCKGNVCHAAAQTDLVELITGSSQPSDKIITPSPTPPGSWSGGSSTLERQASLRMLSSHRTHTRTASLRLSPNKVALLSTAFGNVPPSILYSSNTYKAQDMSDITVRAGERGSVLSKLLRVSPRRRLGSFSAQFPPPEWSSNSAPAVHLHCVAIQTLSQHKQQEEKEFWWSATSQWTPRSATLPRRLRRPQSSTPPLSQRSDSSSAAPQHMSLIHIQDSHFLSHMQLQMSPSHCSRTPAKEKEERLMVEASPINHCGEPLLIMRSHKNRSPAHQHYDNREHRSPGHSSTGNHKHRSPVHSNTENHKHRLPTCHNIENHRHRPPVHKNSEIKVNGSCSSHELSPKRRSLNNQESTKKEIQEHHLYNAIIESQTNITRVPAQAARKKQTPLKQKQSKEELQETLEFTCANVSADVNTKKSGETLSKSSGEREERTVQDDRAQKYENQVSQQHKHRSHHSVKDKNHKQQESNLKNRSTERHQRREKDRQDNKDTIASDANKKCQTNHLKSNTNISCENKEEKNKKIIELKRNEKEQQVRTSQSSKKLECKEEKWNENCQLQKLKRGLPGKSDDISLQYDRSSLQLDLATNMNNSRKVVSSPQRPEGLKNNMLHNDSGLTDISKGPCQDLTSRNLGYQEVDKCHKQMCSQTLDQVQQQTVTHTQHQQVTSYSKQQCLCSPKKKVSPGADAQNEANIVVSDNKQKMSKDENDRSPGCVVRDENKVGGSPDTEGMSLSTYPSLSELNLNFSSLAAQKILCGTSINSIDTLVEVNLAAEKHNINNKPDSVTNTDFGFL